MAQSKVAREGNGGRGLEITRRVSPSPSIDKYAGCGIFIIPLKTESIINANIFIPGRLRRNFNYRRYKFAAIIAENVRVAPLLGGIACTAAFNAHPRTNTAQISLYEDDNYIRSIMRLPCAYCIRIKPHASSLLTLEMPRMPHVTCGRYVCDA